MAKKRYTEVAKGDAKYVVVERKYGCEWRKVGQYDTLNAALTEHPTARDRGQAARS